MDANTSLDTLGLTSTATWDDIRRAHRDAIRRTHPDAGGDPASAAKVNQAFDALRRATQSGTVPLPAVPPAGRAKPVPEAGRQVIDLDDPAEVLLRLAAAAHDIGDVVFVDPIAGLMEVVVGDAPAVGQLTVEVGAPTSDSEGVPVAFTLDALGVTPAPPIAAVVADLMAQYRRQPTQ